MTIQKNKINIDRDALHDLYKHHQDEGVDLPYNSDSFVRILEGYLTPYAEFLFEILPKCPRIQKYYFSSLDDVTEIQIHALADLCGVTPPITHPDIQPGDLPDIKLWKNKDNNLKVGTFKDDMPDIKDLIEDALYDFWDNFTLDEMKALDANDQARLVELWKNSKIMKRNSKQHLKLVYGLHLPQDLLEYHTECLNSLAAQVIVNEDLYAGLACFLDKTRSTALNLPYLEREEDKRRLVSTFMNTMAEIWNIPEPVQQDYNKPPEKDKSGKDFSEFMHAFYVAAANDNDPDTKMGLIYGANTHKGYLEGDRSYTLQSLAHEFGHLLSSFVVIAHANSHLIESQPRKDQIRNFPHASMANAKNILSTNSPSTIKGKYYTQTGTDFSGITYTANDNTYSGQLEERHADWLGDGALEYITFALDNRDHINDFDHVKTFVTEKTKQVTLRTSLYHFEPEIFKDIYTGIHNARNFNELEIAMEKTCAELDAWLNQNPKKKRKKQLSGQIATSSQIIGPSNEKAKKSFQDLKNFCNKIFDVRKIALDYGYETQPHIQNALTP